MEVRQDERLEVVLSVRLFQAEGRDGVLGFRVQPVARAAASAGQNIETLTPATRQCTHGRVIGLALFIHRSRFISVGVYA